MFYQMTNRVFRILRRPCYLSLPDLPYPFHLTPPLPSRYHILHLRFASLASRCKPTYTPPLPHNHRSITSLRPIGSTSFHPKSLHTSIHFHQSLSPQLSKLSLPTPAFISRTWTSLGNRETLSILVAARITPTTSFSQNHLQGRNLRYVHP